MLSKASYDNSGSFLMLKGTSVTFIKKRKKNMTNQCESLRQ